MEEEEQQQAEGSVELDEFKANVLRSRMRLPIHSKLSKPPESRKQSARARRASVFEENADDAEDTSNDDAASQPAKRRRMGSGDSSKSSDTTQDFSSTYFPAEMLTEYKWPGDDAGEYYMLQEQVSEYLGVTSFKRKYPDLERRDLSHKEKLYLREMNVITETQCTLGLTALRSDEVIDLMIKEYPTKYAEYAVVLQERERQQITDRYKEYSQLQLQNTQKVEPSKVPEYIKKAAKKAAEFNSNFNRERMEERRAYFDLQTQVIQVPQGKYKVLPPERTKVGAYPVALIPGQFQEYYKRYSPNELRYLPVNTALYEPPLDPELPAPDSDGDSDDAEDGRGEDERKEDKGLSDTSSGSTTGGESPTEHQDDSSQGKQTPKERGARAVKDAKRSVTPKSVTGYKIFSSVTSPFCPRALAALLHTIEQWEETRRLWENVDSTGFEPRASMFLINQSSPVLSTLKENWNLSTLSLSKVTHLLATSLKR
ncbi:PHD finger protein 10 isoform X3 [Narcine bancroftii]|uniref:PHD finger protein 10 isoform X3 n=1 Tax=Narcine bancroftii TaxID=1343680 RepID=UPI003831DB76